MTPEERDIIRVVVDMHENLTVSPDCDCFICKIGRAVNAYLLKCDIRQVCNICGQTVCACVGAAQKKGGEIEPLNHNDTLPMVINMVNLLIDVINKLNGQSKS